MHAITFYSFKGGVGRTMALVNVGLELARRGRRVLFVDFDLEAPGLSTYSVLEGQSRCRGLVEYVRSYLARGEAPDVREYAYPVNLCERVPNQGFGKSHLFGAAASAPTGQVWVMPAGRLDEDYGANLAEINWRKLYERHDGYLFFEDTKRQWAEAFKPDYVLIDSRTGHTDIGGICTRQLADSVVLLFFPNEQNRLGLQGVCDSIRAESRETGREIGMHLVMSNVPYLDDEERILRRQRDLFLRTLQVPEMSVIYRYESLMHLDQRAFVLERPRSRLAKQYRRLTRHLMLSNPRDREGAMLRLEALQQHADFLKEQIPDLIQPSLFDESPARTRHERMLRSHMIAEQVEVISSHFATDQVVLLQAAKTYSDLSDFANASSVLDRAIQLQDNAEARLLRSRARFQLGRTQEAIDDLLAGVHIAGAQEITIVESLRDLHRLCREQLHSPESWAIMRELSPEGKVRVVDLVATKEDQFQKAVELLSSALEKLKPVQYDATQYHRQLAVYLLYRQEWAKVVDLLKEDHEFIIRRYKILTLFLKGMGLWGHTGSFPVPLAQEIAALRGASSATDTYPSDCQALALVYWRVGKLDMARAFAGKALKMGSNRTGRQLSYWRCLDVPPTAFVEDCRQLMRMLETGEVRPAVFDKR